MKRTLFLVTTCSVIALQSLSGQSGISATPNTPLQPLASAPILKFSKTLDQYNQVYLKVLAATDDLRAQQDVNWYMTTNHRLALEFMAFDDDVMVWGLLDDATRKAAIRFF